MENSKSNHLTFGQKLKNLWNYFSVYEKVWFFSILVLSIIIAILFPEEDANGVNGKIILALYLADIFLNILCELLISKQSKWNFIVSLFVEIVEIDTLIILSARFATMLTTLFFWIPIDIISFINWNKHKDTTETELTVVRKFKWWQALILIAITIVWTAGIGYLVAAYGPDSDFYASETIEKAVAYLDACASIFGMANGLLILLRFREQWITWYLSCILEIVMNILLGQWVLLVLKFGYLTNTTYGYIKWTKYINKKPTTIKPSEQIAELQ